MKLSKYLPGNIPGPSVFTEIFIWEGFNSCFDRLCAETSCNNTLQPGNCLPGVNLDLIYLLQARATPGGWRCRGFVLPGKFVLPEPLHPQAGYPSCVPPVHAVHTRSTQGECVWNVSITSKIMFNMFQTYCIKQIPQQYLKRILFFILIDCKCIKHMLRIYFIYCICKILSNLYRRKPQSHHRIGSRAGPFGKLTF